MNISLLADGPMVVTAIILACLLTFLINSAWKKLNKTHLIISAALALFASLVLQRILEMTFASDKLPWELFIIFFPFFLTLSLQVIFWRTKFKKNQRKLKWIALATIPIALVMSLLLVNRYYQFYPTLYSFLNIESRQAATDNLKTTVIQFSDPPSNNFDATSIEAAIYGATSPNTNGSLLPITIPGTKSNFKARSGYVYVPAAANLAGQLHLPVLILLPGVPGLTRNTLDGFDLVKTMDNFAKFHKGIVPYVFMLDDSGSLNNDTECVDSSRGNVETYLTVDVPNYIKNNYSVNSSPSGWAIGGLSMGGMCAAMLTLRHTDVYHYFLDFGGESGPETGSKSKTISDLFGGSENAWNQHQINTLLAIHNYKNQSIGGYFVAARNDLKTLVNSIHDNYLQAKQSGIESLYESINGNHTFNVWAQGYKDSVAWLSNRLGATICSVGCK